MAFIISNIKLTTSRPQLLAAVKKYFNLYDLPLTECVAKLDQVLRDGITLEYLSQVEKFGALNAFTYDLVETLSEYQRWEKEQGAKLERACQWYNNLSEENQEFVNLLRGHTVSNEVALSAVEINYTK